MLTARWLQIPHRRFHIAVPKPMLHGPEIDTRPEASGRKSRAELVQPEVILIELRPFRARFEAVEEIQFRIAP